MEKIKGHKGFFVRGDEVPRQLFHCKGCGRYFDLTPAEVEQLPFFNGYRWHCRVEL